MLMRSMPSVSMGDTIPATTGSSTHGLLAPTALCGASPSRPCTARRMQPEDVMRLLLTVPQRAKASWWSAPWSAPSESAAHMQLAYATTTTSMGITGRKPNPASCSHEIEK